MSTIPTGTYVIDAVHSSVGFQARHGGIAKVRGQFREFAGQFTVAEPFSASSVTVEIAAGSVDTGKAERDGHLTSPDFWDAAKNPTWTYQSTSVEGEGEDFVVHGTLTANGITKPVDLSVEFEGAAKGMDGSDTIGFSATATVSRKDFDMTWNVALEGGGLLVGDKVKIEIDVEAVKQTAATA